METSRRDFFTSLAAGWALATKARVDSKKSFPDFPKGAEVVECDEAVERSIAIHPKKWTAESRARQKEFLGKRDWRP